MYLLKESNFFFFLLSFFLLSHTKLLTGIPYKLSRYELLHAHNDIVFVVVVPFSPFVSKQARVLVLASCGSANF